MKSIRSSDYESVLEDMKKTYPNYKLCSHDDLAPGKMVIFCATPVTGISKIEIAIKNLPIITPPLLTHRYMVRYPSQNFQ